MGDCQGQFWFWELSRKYLWKVDGSISDLCFWGCWTEIALVLNNLNVFRKPVRYPKRDYQLSKESTSFVFCKSFLNTFGLSIFRGLHGTKQACRRHACTLRLVTDHISRFLCLFQDGCCRTTKAVSGNQKFQPFYYTQKLQPHFGKYRWRWSLRYFDHSLL